MGRNIPSATLGIKLRPYKGMERNSRVQVQSGGGEKVVCRFGRFGGSAGRERIDELGNLRLVGIADDPSDSGKGG